MLSFGSTGVQVGSDAGLIVHHPFCHSTTRQVLHWGHQTRAGKGGFDPSLSIFVYFCLCSASYYGVPPDYYQRAYFKSQVTSTFQFVYYLDWYLCLEVTVDRIR